MMKSEKVSAKETVQKTENKGKSGRKKTGWGKIAIRIIALLAAIFVAIPWLIVKFVPDKSSGSTEKMAFSERLKAASAEEKAITLFSMRNPEPGDIGTFEAITAVVGIKREYGDFVLSVPEGSADTVKFEFINGHDSGMNDSFVTGMIRYSMLLLALSDDLDTVLWTFPEGSENEDIGWTRKDADKYLTEVVKAGNKLKDYTVSADGIQLLMNEFGIDT